MKMRVDVSEWFEKACWEVAASSARRMGIILNDGWQDELKKVVVLPPTREDLITGKVTLADDELGCLDMSDEAYMQTQRGVVMKTAKFLDGYNEKVHGMTEGAGVKRSFDGMVSHDPND